MARSMKDLGFLNPSRTAFFMCDVQEKFRSLTTHFDEVVSVAKKMVRLLYKKFVVYTHVIKNV